LEVYDAEIGRKMADSVPKEIKEALTSSVDVFALIKSNIAQLH
jgi:hypothetical protein